MKAAGIAADEAFWLAVRDNCAKVSDAGLWWPVVAGDITPVITDEDRDYLAAARSLLPDGEVGPSTWKAWTEALKAASGRKGRGLFMPLRQELTGHDHGPDMNVLLPLIGRKRILDRLA